MPDPYGDSELRDGAQEHPDALHPDGAERAEAPAEVCEAPVSFIEDHVDGLEDADLAEELFQAHWNMNTAEDDYFMKPSKFHAKQRDEAKAYYKSLVQKVSVALTLQALRGKK